MNQLRRNIAAVTLATLVGCAPSGGGKSGRVQVIPDCDEVLQTVGTDRSRIGFPIYNVDSAQVLLNVINGSDLPGDFSYYGGAIGGIGNILATIGCGGSTYLEYIGGGLSSIALRSWPGETDTGLMIWDSIERFQELYPTARKREVYTNLQAGDTWTAGHFKVNIFLDRVRFMEVSRHNYDLDDPDERTEVVGPQWGPEPWH